MSAMTHLTPTGMDARWAAVVARDACFDKKFVYAVKTTGVFCRPTCPSRRAKPTLYCSGDEAVAAGFRPCKHCRPQ